MLLYITITCIVIRYLKAFYVFIIKISKCFKISLIITNVWCQLLHFCIFHPLMNILTIIQNLLDYLFSTVLLFFLMSSENYCSHCIQQFYWVFKMIPSSFWALVVISYVVNVFLSPIFILPFSILQLLYVLHFLPWPYL